MQHSSSRAFVSMRPRVLVIGALRDALGRPSGGLVEAMRACAEVRHEPATSPVRQSLSVLARARGAIVRDGYEMVHVLDPRFAGVASILRRRYGVPVSASVSDLDAASRTPIGALAMRALDTFDQGFASDDAVAATLRRRAPGLPVAVVQPAIQELPWPSKRAVARVAAALRNVRPGRLIVALPWPADRNDLRWFRDVVLPQMQARPICLLMGAPNRRDARLLVGQQGVRDDFRVLAGRLTADTIAAVARCADAFAVAAPNGRNADAGGDLVTTLATGGIPVVTNGVEDPRVLAHESNAFVVDPADEHTYVQTLNQVLALPAVQRHFMGEEFARYTLSRRRWSGVAEIYADRFAALVGRPQIPADLRAA